MNERMNKKINPQIKYYVAIDNNSLLNSIEKPNLNQLPPTPMKQGT